MIIELRATERLRAPRSLDVGGVVATVMRAVQDGSLDLDHLRIVCDWIQYRHCFREPVDLRPILPLSFGVARPTTENGLETASSFELAVDLRRSERESFASELVAAIARAARGENDQRFYLEPWTAGATSCIWAFNTLFWRNLRHWEETAGRGYEQALRGGQSDARDVGAAQALILTLFATWDALAARRALPEELHVLELGVGNGNQALVWLDTFRRLDRERGSDFYRRLHYLMGDYSPAILEMTRAKLAHHADRLSSLVLDATRPTQTLGFLRYKAFLVYISNVYDNLPTDELVSLGGRLFQVQVRAYLSAESARAVATRVRVEPAELMALVSRLLRLGPELLAESLPRQFPTTSAAVEFWQQVWEGLRLEERYVPFEELDAYEIAPGIGGQHVMPIISGHGDIRMHLSNGAVASFTETLELLHPLGVLQCHDLFVTDVHQYDRGFRGPGKYDGSVVNWVNGPLLSSIGARRGFDVRFTPFTYRPGSSVTTLTTSARE